MSKLTILVVKLLLLCIIGAFMSFTFIHFVKDLFILNISLIMLACGLAIACGLETKQYVKSKSITISSINENLKSISFDIGADQFVDVYAKTALMFIKHCIPADVISQDKLKKITESIESVTFDGEYLLTLENSRVLPTSLLRTSILEHYLHVIIKHYITDSVSHDTMLRMLPQLMRKLQDTLNQASATSENTQFTLVIDAFNY